MTTEPTTYGPHGKPVSFDEIVVGDVVTFLTADNGFGGSGNQIERRGTVTGKTDKVVDLHVGGGIPVFRNGKSRIEGDGARLRRDAWSARSVRLQERTPVPRDADHVVYADMGNIVWALWTADPVKAADPQALADTIHHPANADAELILTMQRQTKAAGYTNHGWYTQDGSELPDYAGATKAEAMTFLRQAVAERINR